MTQTRQVAALESLYSDLGWGPSAGLLTTVHGEGLESVLSEDDPYGVWRTDDRVATMVFVRIVSKTPGEVS